MRNLCAVTKDILQRVETQTGKTIEFMPDANLQLLVTLQIARNGADFHILRYQPGKPALDYLIAYQAGFVLRLFDNDPVNRFDFASQGQAGASVETLLTTGQPLSAQDKLAVPEFANFVAHWSLMNLRSLPVGMRIDQWLASEFPDIREMQQTGLAIQQQQNVAALTYHLGKLTIPVTLMGQIAAYALFVDRLLGVQRYSIPFEAAGALDHGRSLLRIWDETPSDARHDCELVDRWATACGMSKWYNWIAYQP